MASEDSHRVDRSDLRERLAFLARWKYDLPEREAATLAEELLAAYDGEAAHGDDHTPDLARLVALLNGRRPAAADGHPARREALCLLAGLPAGPRGRAGLRA